MLEIADNRSAQCNTLDSARIDEPLAVDSVVAPDNALEQVRWLESRTGSPFCSALVDD